MTSEKTPDIPAFLTPGTRTEIGKYEFTAENIIPFARKFDPQRFHTDPEAAKTSMLGGLCASGWHTASAWMALQRHSVEAFVKELKEQGHAYP